MLRLVVLAALALAGLAAGLGVAWGDSSAGVRPLTTGTVHTDPPCAFDGTNCDPGKRIDRVEQRLTGLQRTVTQLEKRVTVLQKRVTVLSRSRARR